MSSRLGVYSKSSALEEEVGVRRVNKISGRSLVYGRTYRANSGAMPDLFMNICRRGRDYLNDLKYEYL